MTRKYFFLIGTLLTAALLVATYLAYPNLPDQVPRHFGLNGEVNAYMPKQNLYIFGPGLMALILLLTTLYPWLSPKGFQIQRSGPSYLWITLSALGMMAFIQGAMLWSLSGHALNLPQAISAAVCVLFIVVGNILGKVRRNFFVGVRTPWSLADERVWNATQRFAAKTFVIGGIAGIVFVATGLKPLVPVTIIAAAVIPIVYSLILSKRMERHDQP